MQSWRASRRIGGHRRTRARRARLHGIGLVDGLLGSELGVLLARKRERELRVGLRANERKIRLAVLAVGDERASARYAFLRESKVELRGRRVVRTDCNLLRYPR